MNLFEPQKRIQKLKLLSVVVSSHHVLFWKNPLLHAYPPHLFVTANQNSPAKSKGRVWEILDIFSFFFFFFDFFTIKVIDPQMPKRCSKVCLIVFSFQFSPQYGMNHSLFEDCPLQLYDNWCFTYFCFCFIHCDILLLRSSFSCMTQCEVVTMKCKEHSCENCFKFKEHINEKNTLVTIVG